MSIVTRTIAIALVSTIAAREAELVLEETCNGWRTRGMALNVSSLKPQTWHEMIVPICWGRHHDDCRSNPATRRRSHPTIFNPRSRSPIMLIAKIELRERRGPLRRSRSPP